MPCGIILGLESIFIVQVWVWASGRGILRARPLWEQKVFPDIVARPSSACMLGFCASVHLRIPCTDKPTHMRTRGNIIHTASHSNRHTGPRPVGIQHRPQAVRNLQVRRVVLAVLSSMGQVVKPELRSCLRRLRSISTFETR